MSNFRTDNLTRAAEAFRALSNPHRLRIFLRLATCCGGGSAVCVEDEVPCCVGDLGRDLEVAPSTVSHHLRELRRAGLVEMERRGRFIECRVDPERVQELSTFFARPGDALPEPRGEES
jgi:ArsR family transcriptional regulator